MTFADFIAEKGSRALAIVLGVSEGTTRSWASRNGIPRDHWDRLMEVYPRLKYRDLRDMESASKTGD